MKFNEQIIKGVYLIDPTPFEDERGVFRRHFCSEEFNAHGIDNEVLQANISENKFKYTLRGFHYQSGESAEGKTLSCLKGTIYDVVVDLRKESATYMQWLAFELSAKNKTSIHIPKGCANAFLTMEDDCLIQYYCSNRYDQKNEKGIRFNDESFAFIWPVKPLIVSEKDKNHPNYVK